MDLSDYNGWENKFTWLVHLHLSSEERLMHEMVSLVADTPIGYPVGKLVEPIATDRMTAISAYSPGIWSVRLWRMQIGICLSGS